VANEKAALWAATQSLRFYCFLSSVARLTRRSVTHALGERGEWGEGERSATGTKVWGGRRSKRGGGCAPIQRVRSLGPAEAGLGGAGAVQHSIVKAKAKADKCNVKAASGRRDARIRRKHKLHSTAARREPAHVRAGHPHRALVPHIIRMRQFRDRARRTQQTEPTQVRPYHTQHPHAPPQRPHDEQHHNNPHADGSQCSQMGW
jgi:hypothetical protein